MKNKIEFELPAGLELPEGTKDGDKVELMAELQVKNGKLCLVSIEGNSMPGYSEEEKKEEEPGEYNEKSGMREGEFMEKYRAGMGESKPEA